LQQNTEQVQKITATSGGNV